MAKDILPLGVHVGEANRRAWRLVVPSGLLFGGAWATTMFFVTGTLAPIEAAVMGMFSGTLFGLLFPPLMGIAVKNLVRTLHKGTGARLVVPNPPFAYDYQLVCITVTGLSRLYGVLAFGSDQVQFLPITGGFQRPAVVGPLAGMVVEAVAPTTFERWLIGRGGGIVLRSGDRSHRFDVPEAEFAADAVRQLIEKLDQGSVAPSSSRNGA